MNERIEQLWEEAAKTTQGDSWEEQTKFMEKFAQLIIQDIHQYVDSMDTAQIISTGILRRYGVEL